MKIGLVGGNGFIGSWVAQKVKESGNHVAVFDHVRRPLQPNVDEMFWGDVRDETDVFEFAAHVDGIIHLAAVLGTQETIQNPLPSVMTNIVGSLNVFEAANRYDLPCVYLGVANHFFRNEGATGSYTISKTCAEDYARMFNAYRKGQICIVRPVNAYGPRQSIASPYGASRVRKIMPSFICRALMGHEIEVYGNGTQVSDCVYVSDVANVLLTALVNEMALGIHQNGAIEVGPRESVTVGQIAELVQEYVQGRYGVEQQPIKYLPMRPGEISNSVIQADYSTLDNINMDARNFVPLIQGIARTVDYYVEEWWTQFKQSSRL